jgi:hypothetical protein
MNELRAFRAHLKQEGKQLKLLATLPAQPEVKPIIASAREFFASLRAAASRFGQTTRE